MLCADIFSALYHFAGALTAKRMRSRIGDLLPRGGGQYGNSGVFGGIECFVGEQLRCANMALWRCVICKCCNSKLIEFADRRSAPTWVRGGTMVHGIRSVWK